MGYREKTFKCVEVWRYTNTLSYILFSCQISRLTCWVNIICMCYSKIPEVYIYLNVKSCLVLSIVAEFYIRQGHRKRIRTKFKVFLMYWTILQKHTTFDSRTYSDILWIFLINDVASIKDFATSKRCIHYKIWCTRILN